MEDWKRTIESHKLSSFNLESFYFIDYNVCNMNDVENLLRKNNIKFTIRGKELICNCLNPRHARDRHPSMYIDSESGMFHCWSCGFKGNLITLQRLFGEDKPYINYTKRYEKVTVEKGLPKIIGTPKPLDGEVLDFVHNLGCTDEFIRNYGIKESHYSEGIADNLYMTEDKFTPLDNRIMFPIYDENGIIINYECRTYVGADPKVLYIRGCSTDTLFNYINIDKNETVIFTESAKNLFRGYNVNKNIISNCGNQLTEHKIKLLNEIKELIFFADYDVGSLGGYDLKTNMYRPGLLQKLMEVYRGKLYVTFYPKCYRDKKSNKIKGYDMNDLSLVQIKECLNKLYDPREVSEYYRDKITW